MRALSQYLSKTYSMKLTVTLSLAFIIAGNCARMGGQKVAESSVAVYTEFSYYPSGQQEYTAEYLHGKLDGISRHWSEDGLLISEAEYSNGNLHGIWKKYYANQNTMYEAHYFHGQKQGKEKWYYENGQIKSEQSFYYGVPASTIIRWHPDGSIIY